MAEDFFQASQAVRLGWSAPPGVVWSGVPIRVVAEKLGGVLPGAMFVTGTGGERLPEGLDPLSVIVERSVPVQTLDDALLAWEMNGAPIPLAHGGPLRLIVPGYTGVNNIKYVKRLAFTSVETHARIMSHGYRLAPLGSKSDPSQPSVQEMSVKSWINSPTADTDPLKAGQMQIHALPSVDCMRSAASKYRSMVERRGRRHDSLALILADMRGDSLYSLRHFLLAVTHWRAVRPIPQAINSLNDAWKTRGDITTPAGSITLSK